jgi:hypothetical protein
MRVLRKALNEIAKLMEKHASVAQGKGWGSSTVEKEVAALFDLLKTPPPEYVSTLGATSETLQQL